MADFWGGVAQGFAPAYKGALARREREAKEKKADEREREKLEAEAEAYSVILARLRGEEAGEDPLKPLVVPAGADLLPKLEQGPRSPVTRRQLLTGGITGKADIAALRAKIAERKATAAQELVRQQKLEDDRRKSEEASQIRFEQQQEARAVRKAEEERRKAADIAGRRKEMRERLAGGAALPPRLRPDPTGTVDDPFIPKLPAKPFAPDRPVTPRELAIMAAETPEAKRTAAAALREQMSKEEIIKAGGDAARKLQHEVDLSKIPTRPSGTPVKPPTSVEERRNDELIKLSKAWQTTDPSKRSTIERQAQLLLSANREPMVTPEATRQWLDTSTSPPAPSGRSKAPTSPLELSKEDQEHLASARTMQFFKNQIREKYTDKDAKKNLTIWGQLNHWGRNLAAPALGVEAWKDKSAARYMADANALTARALQVTHQMMGGGAFSEPDRILYRKTIPHTDTYSPVHYMAKMDAWADDLDSYVNYMSARQKIGELPRLVSELEPWQLIKYQGKKGEDGKEIISKGMVKMLIEYNQQGLNPDTNQRWTGDALLAYQKEHEANFSKDDLLEFLRLLPYEVAPPR